MMNEQASNDGREEEKQEEPPLYPDMSNIVAPAPTLPPIVEDPSPSFDSAPMTEKDWERKRGALDAAARTPNRAPVPVGAQFVPGQAPGAPPAAPASPIRPATLGAVSVTAEGDAARPGAQSIPRRAPGNVPVWGRRMPRSILGSSRGGSRTSGHGSDQSTVRLEATPVTDAEPVVYATRVQRDGEEGSCKSLFHQKRVWALVAGLLAVIVGVVIAAVIVLGGKSERDSEENPSTKNTRPANSSSLTTIPTMTTTGTPTTTLMPSPVPSAAPTVYCELPPTPSPSNNELNLTQLRRCRCNWTIPPKSNRFVALKDALVEMNVTNETDLAENCSSQHLALSWIADEDERLVAVNDSHTIIQRYAMAILYFATNGDKWGKNVFEREEDGHQQKSWLSSSGECYWHGVRCEEKENSTVERIRLREHNLNGTLPSEIAMLSELKILNLYGNSLKGTIPSEIGKLKKLRILKLVDNQMSGAIDTANLTLRNLAELSLSKNYFTGKIPSVLGSLARLRMLDLGNNSFTGEIPLELTDAKQLQFLNLAQNRINGTIPPRFGELDDLVALVLSDNLLTGGIPDQLSEALDLGFLCLQGNDMNPEAEFNASICTDLVYLEDIRVDEHVGCGCSICTNHSSVDDKKSPCTKILYGGVLNLNVFGICT